MLRTLSPFRLLRVRFYAADTLKGLGILGIRREDKNRWERRAPLAPPHVQHLTQNGIRVIVQPSNVRINTDEEYAEAGAEIAEDLSPCNVVLGVKEVPIAKLLPNRTYMFFSHTIKVVALVTCTVPIFFQYSPLLNRRNHTTCLCWTPA